MRNLPKAEARGESREPRHAGFFAIHGACMHGAPAQNGFSSSVHVRQLFVAANVHGTDDNRLRAAARTAQRPLISKKTARRQRVAIHEQEFSNDTDQRLPRRYAWRLLTPRTVLMLCRI